MVEEHSGYDVLGEIKINGASGTAGQALMSGGAAALPTFGAPAPATHGAAQHTDATREKFYSVADCVPDDGLTSIGHGACLSLTDTADESGRWVIRVPDDFVSFTSLKLVWVSSVVSGNMYWTFYTQYGASGEAYATHTDTPALAVTATGGANVINVQESANAIAFSGLALGDYIGIRLRRDGSHVDDTLSANVDVFGILFTYVASQ